jgi:hypothetical protein
MKRPLSFLVPFVLLCASGLSQESEPFYVAADQTAELVAKEGQKIVVHGETENSAKSASGTNFVNFKGSEFFLVTFKSDLGPFGESEPHLVYDKQRVAVEGVIALHQGKPQIKLTDPDQITMLAPDAVFPPPLVKKEEAPTEAKEKPMSPGKSTASPPAPEPVKPKPPVDPSEYFKK